MELEDVKVLFDKVCEACDANIPKGIDQAWSNQSGSNIKWDDLRKALKSYLDLFETDEK